MVQASPNTGNYYVGKGVMKINVTGIDTGWRLLGNCPTFELTPAITKLPHYSAQKGTKFKDANVTQIKELSMKMTLDEITPENLQIALFGSETDSTGLGHNILDLDEIIAAVRFVGTNAVGDKQQVDLPTVSITPGAGIGFISDGWAQLELAGDVTADENGVFGTIYSGIDGEIDP
jgi:hypothetical protein